MLEGMLTMSPLLDLMVAALLGAVLWRLRRDPAAAWRVHEQRLQATCEGLRTLVAEAQEQARTLDASLAAHARELRALLATSAPRTTASVDATDGKVARRVRDLAAKGTAVEEIARRLELPPAEVRLLVGLQTARATGREANGKNGAAESAG